VLLIELIVMLRKAHGEYKYRKKIQRDNEEGGWTSAGKVVFHLGSKDVPPPKHLQKHVQYFQHLKTVHVDVLRQLICFKQYTIIDALV